MDVRTESDQFQRQALFTEFSASNVALLVVVRLSLTSTHENAKLVISSDVCVCVTANQIGQNT